MGDRPGFFAPNFLERLTALHLVAGRAAGGGRPADRTASRVGSGTDFADHREYMAGDDPRQIDWRLYGRSGSLFTKQYHAEEDRTVTIALDCSASMDAEPGKFEFARKLAAALCFVALSDRDAVALCPFRDSLHEPLPDLRGRPSFPRVIDRLGGLQAGGRTDLGAVSRELAARSRRQGLLLIISDFMDGPSPGLGLSAVCGTSVDVGALQVFTPAERAPEARGFFRLQDVETGAMRALTLDRRMARRFTEAFDAYSEELSSRCRGLGIRHLRLPTDTSMEEAVLKRLRTAGLAA